MAFKPQAAAELLAFTCVQLSVVDLRSIGRNGDEASLDAYVSFAIRCCLEWLAVRLVRTKGQNLTKAINEVLDQAKTLILNHEDYMDVAPEVKELVFLHLFQAKSVACNPPDGIV